MSRPAGRRSLFLALSALVLLVAVGASVAVGSNALPLAEVWHQLWSPDGSAATTVVRELRLPRTVLGLLVGAALGTAGSLMQSLTRNPLGDPGVLGINAGAALAVVTVVAVTGVAQMSLYVWFGLLGAGLAAVAVTVLGGTSAGPVAPDRLALAGVAISAAISAIVQMVILADRAVFEEFRLWAAGSLEGRGWPIVGTVAPLLVVGMVAAVALAPRLNAMALGTDTGEALGLRVKRTRMLTMATVAVLCGAATAAVGPIAFVGLGVPALARAFMGPDQRWVLPCSVLLGASLLLAADVAGRLVVTPDELQVGIVTALVGGPVFVAIVRRRRIPAL